MLLQTTHEHVIRHAHLFCGIGAGAKGFNQANPRVQGMRAKFVCTGGIDVDPGAIRNFDRLTGVKGTVMDLFSRDQYVTFHGKAAPAGWTEATPADVRRALDGPNGERPDIIFLSAPCKGFSGLLSAKQSKTDKYQALNALTLRGIWLVCEAYKDGPIPVIIFENVPRILTRGRPLLDQISAILRSYSYNVAETVHDCGVIGGLAQRRKRMLLIARQVDQVPCCIYEPKKLRLKGVGERIGLLPLPGDPIAGPMHRVPALQWKTWMRLAFVPAGKDWRALNELAVVDGVLRDYGIIPEHALRDGALGVHHWNDTAGTVVGNQRSPLHGRHAVADPRPADAANQTYQQYGVAGWDGTINAVTAQSKPGGGTYAVADPRAPKQQDTNLGVHGWDDTSTTVKGRSGPTNGANAVADPRVDGHPRSVQLGVKGWGDTAGVVKGDCSVGGGPYAVADIRLGDRPRFNNSYRIVRFDEPANAVAGPGGPAGSACVADPRPNDTGYATRKYQVTRFEDSSRAVIGASTTGDGAFAVADPRCTWGANSHRNKLRVTPDDQPAGSITGADRVGSGAPSVADSRREHYQTSGHYGVVPWAEPSDVVSATIGHDNGKGNVADPRPLELEETSFALPPADKPIVCRIVSLDDCWHRPFTTLELCTLQSIVDPEEAFYQDQDGVWQARFDVDLLASSDAAKREWIGNAVPSESAKKIGEVIGQALLLARSGQTFQLSNDTIWVSPIRAALAVDTDQDAFRMDRGLM